MPNRILPAEAMGATGPSIWRRVAPLAFVLVVGSFLGVLAEQAGFLPFPWYFLALLGSPWLLASFVAGRLCGTRAGAAGAGFGLLATGLGANTIHKALSYGVNAIRPLLSEWPYWLLLAAVLGSLAGLAGSLTKSSKVWTRAWGWSFPLGVVFAEAGAIQLGFQPFGARVAGALVVAGAILFVVGARKASLWKLLLATTVLAAGLVAALPLARAIAPVF